MEISFHENSLITGLTIIGETSQDYNVIIDTGSNRTSIPIIECKFLGLKFAGTERVMTSTGDLYVPIFYAKIIVGKRQFDNNSINGIEGDTCLLGLDILCRYKLTIDWLSSPKLATAEY